MTSTPTAALSEAGVSIWLDDLSRERITSGSLKDLIADRNVVGVTTNPSIFAAALANGESYAAQVQQLADTGAGVDKAVFEITTDPARLARGVAYVDSGLAGGMVDPVIDTTFDLADIADAHRYMEGNSQIGKIVVTVPH